MVKTKISILRRRLALNQNHPIPYDDRPSFAVEDSTKVEKYWESIYLAPNDKQALKMAVNHGDTSVHN